MLKNLNQLSYNVIEQLKSKSLKIGTAESCTGGMLAQYLTMHPGSSAAFNYGFITYSNNSKINFLNINKKDIDTFGAVSKEVAIAMAINLFKNKNLDIAISVTGIAGPEGGSNEKPVGLVHHALHTKNTLIHKQIIYNGNREVIRQSTVETCLKLTLEELKKNI